jgi:predicted TIM-barrel fold metal-dependent hydrolase
MIDTDIHYEFLGLPELLPWVDPAQRDYLANSDFALPGGLFPNPQHYVRQDSVPDPEIEDHAYRLLCEQLLDPFEIELGIVNGGGIGLLVGCLPNAKTGAAIARAWNRWMIEDLMARDERLLGALVVPSQDPALAAEMIREFGDHPGIVQVMLSYGATSGYGHSNFDPIHRACVDTDIVMGIHVGAEGQGVNPPLGGVGHPTYYVEYHSLMIVAAMAHTASMICEGVFERYPTLRFCVIEGGVAWIPEIFWRLDANWKRLGHELPWLERSPSEVMREQIRFTTQPLEQPPNPRQLRQFLEGVGGLDELLMFATDYPHWDFDAPDRALPSVVRGELRQKIMADNATAFYDFERA